MEIEDIPRAVSIRTLKDSQSYPQQHRYTAQWLTSNEDYFEQLANNTDAAFKKNGRKGKLPYSLLLDYIYGAAAVKHWAKNEERFNGVVPPQPAGVGTSKRNHIPRSEDARLDMHNRRFGAGPISTIQEENEDGKDAEKPKKKMDPEELVLMFYATAPGVQERWERENAEKRGGIEQWARGVPGICKNYGQYQAAS